MGEVGQQGTIHTLIKRQFRFTGPNKQIGRRNTLVPFGGNMHASE